MQSAEQVVNKQRATRPCAASAQIGKGLKGRGSDFRLDVDFELAPGVTILFGSSGAGKTTLLDCIAGLVTPDAGKVTIGADVIFDSERGINLPVQRRRIGYVFQDLALFPHLSVERNVRYGISHLGEHEQEKRAQKVLESFRVSGLRTRRPGQISGGEKQRVALARALVTDPCMLLLDEPLAGLDSPTKARIIDDLRIWNAARQIPVLYITHNREEVFALGEHVIALDAGKIVAQGTPHEVMTAPRQEAVAQLAGFENIVQGTVVAAHEDRGTMTCRLQSSNVELETPLLRAEIGESLKIGIRAGDILLATILPQGLSARNVIAGRVIALQRRDVMVSVVVNCGVELEAHLTLAAREALQLQTGSEVWLVIKTYSCHLMKS
jgi:molybdate transport system ATP-binding protein